LETKEEQEPEESSETTRQSVLVLLCTFLHFFCPAKKMQKST
jgi:hypothetical protein